LRPQPEPLASLADCPAVEAAVRDYLTRAGAPATYPGIDVGVRVDPVDRSVTVRLSAPLELPLRIPGSPADPTVAASSTAAVTGAVTVATTPTPSDGLGRAYRPVAGSVVA
jgi:hypothetical protein